MRQDMPETQVSHLNNDSIPFKYLNGHTTLLQKSLPLVLALSHIQTHSHQDTIREYAVF